MTVAAIKCDDLILSAGSLEAPIPNVALTDPCDATRAPSHRSGGSFAALAYSGINTKLPHASGLFQVHLPQFSLAPRGGCKCRPSIRDSENNDTSTLHSE